MLEAKFFFSLMSESEAFLVANLLTRSSLTPFMSALFSFKYAFVWFSFCRATARSCDVLYLHLSPLLLSSFFSLFKLLYFFLISFFFNSAELHLFRHISEFHSFAHPNGYSGECIHQSTVLFWNLLAV